jgi:hypothetical protein
MKILVLGNSDTRGTFVSGPTWTNVARALIAARCDEDVSIDEVRFSAERPGSANFAGQRVAEAAADWVVVPVGTFAFAVGFTWVRVQRIFGKRIAAKYRRAEEVVDQRTRSSGESPGRVSVVLRRMTRAAIGTQPLTTAPRLTEAYCEVLRAVARVETAGVLVVFYPPEKGRYVRNRNYEKLRRGLIEAVSRDAAQHHFSILDSEPLFTEHAGPERLVTTDGFHLEKAGHELLGRAVAAVFEKAG